jgi:hypothetical protein
VKDALIQTIASEIIASRQVIPSWQKSN